MPRFLPNHKFRQNQKNDSASPDTRRLLTSQPSGHGFPPSPAPLRADLEVVRLTAPRHEAACHPSGARHHGLDGGLQSFQRAQQGEAVAVF